MVNSHEFSELGTNSSLQYKESYELIKEAARNKSPSELKVYLAITRALINLSAPDVVLLIEDFSAYIKNHTIDFSAEDEDTDIKFICRMLITYLSTNCPIDTKKIIRSKLAKLLEEIDNVCELVMGALESTRPNLGQQDLSFLISLLRHSPHKHLLLLKRIEQLARHELGVERVHFNSLIKFLILLNNPALLESIAVDWYALGIECLPGSELVSLLRVVEQESFQEAAIFESLGILCTQTIRRIASAGDKELLGLKSFANFLLKILANLQDRELDLFLQSFFSASYKEAGESNTFSHFFYMLIESINPRLENKIFEELRMYYTKEGIDTSKNYYTFYFYFSRIYKRKINFEYLSGREQVLFLCQQPLVCAQDLHELAISSWSNFSIFLDKAKRNSSYTTRIRRVFEQFLSNDLFYFSFKNKLRTAKKGDIKLQDLKNLVEILSTCCQTKESLADPHLTGKIYKSLRDCVDKVASIYESYQFARVLGIVKKNLSEGQYEDFCNYIDLKSKKKYLKAWFYLAAQDIPVDYSLSKLQYMLEVLAKYGFDDLDRFDEFDSFSYRFIAKNLYHIGKIDPSLLDIEFTIHRNKKNLISKVLLELFIHYLKDHPVIAEAAVERKPSELPNDIQDVVKNNLFKKLVELMRFMRKEDQATLKATFKVLCNFPSLNTQASSYENAFLIYKYFAQKRTDQPLEANELYEHAYIGSMLATPQGQVALKWASIHFSNLFIPFNLQSIVLLIKCILWSFSHKNYYFSLHQLNKDIHKSILPKSLPAAREKIKPVRLSGLQLFFSNKNKEVRTGRTGRTGRATLKV